MFQASEFSLRPVHQVRTPQRKHRSQSTHRGTGICSSAWTSENCGVICRGKRANGTYIYKVGSQSGIIKLVQISARKIGTYGGHTSLSLFLYLGFITNLRVRGTTLPCMETAHAMTKPHAKNRAMVRGGSSCIHIQQLSSFASACWDTDFRGN